MTQKSEHTSDCTKTAVASLQQLLKRCLAAALLMVVTAFTLVWGNPLLFALWVSLLVGMGLYEYYTMLLNKGVDVYRSFGVGFGCLMPLVAVFMTSGIDLDEVFLPVIACIGLFVLQFSKRGVPRAFEMLSMTFFGLIYIAWFMSFIVKIRLMPQGAYLVGFFLIVAKGCDVGSYAVGTLWGRHKLLAHVSPNKSLEGFWGGVGTSVICAILFHGWLPWEQTLWQMASLGCFIGVLAQCGDLSESLAKRNYDLKDSGNLIPGFGGVLDVIDSLLFATPLYYVYVNRFF